MYQLAPNAERLYQQMLRTPIEPPTRAAQFIKLIYACAIYLLMAFVSALVGKTIFDGMHGHENSDVGLLAVCAVIGVAAIAIMVLKITHFILRMRYDAHGEELVWLSSQDQHTLVLMRDEHPDVDDAVVEWLGEGRTFGKAQLESCMDFLRKDDSELAERILGNRARAA